LVQAPGSDGGDAATRLRVLDLISDYCTDQSHEKDHFQRTLELCSADAAVRAQLERSFIDIYEWTRAQSPSTPSSVPFSAIARFFARLLAERVATDAASASDRSPTIGAGGISWSVLSCIRQSACQQPTAYSFVQMLMMSLLFDFMSPEQLERLVEDDLPEVAPHIEGILPTDPATPLEDFNSAIGMFGSFNRGLALRLRRAMERAEASTSSPTTISTEEVAAPEGGGSSSRAEE
jgi:hypothetical protein